MIFSMALSKGIDQDQSIENPAKKHPNLCLALEQAALHCVSTGTLTRVVKILLVHITSSS